MSALDEIQTKGCFQLEKRLSKSVNSVKKYKKDVDIKDHTQTTCFIRLAQTLEHEKLISF